MLTMKGRFHHSAVVAAVAVAVTVAVVAAAAGGAAGGAGAVAVTEAAVGLANHLHVLRCFWDVVEFGGVRKTALLKFEFGDSGSWALEGPHNIVGKFRLSCGHLS